MSGIMGWIKRNMLIVIFLLLIVLMVPAGFVFSMMWNGKIQKTADSAFQDDKRSLDGVSKVSYSLPSVFADEQAVEERRPPNAAVTAFFAEQRRARAGQVGVVYDRGIELNRRGHEPLVGGLFPRAEDERIRERLALDLGQLIVGINSRRTVYADLLDRVNAGEVMDGDELATRLGELDKQKRDLIAANTGSDSLSDSKQKELNEEMREQRVALLAARGAEISVYATLEAIVPTTSSERGMSPIPTTVIEPVDEALSFVWQWDYWVIADVLDAIALANSDPLTGSTGVSESVVKRIMRVGVQALDLSAVPVDEFGGGGGRTTGRAGGSWGATHTGRLGERSDAHDVRMVRLEAVVSVERLPRLFDALAQTNFMTVTGLMLEDTDAWNDLGVGYFYGNERVAKATIDIETVWMRDWTVAYMPAPVRIGLGIPLGELEEVNEDEQVEP